MGYEVRVRAMEALTLAAVSVVTPVNGIGRVWKPALDQVWAFLRGRPELSAGKNVFLYHHPAARGEAMRVDFGVSVAGAFVGSGEVVCVETPAGEVAETVHVGSYDGLRGAHDAVHAWCAANGREIGNASWEIYGHWNHDPGKLETMVRYLLR